MFFSPLRLSVYYLDIKIKLHCYVCNNILYIYSNKRKQYYMVEIVKFYIFFGIINLKPLYIENVVPAIVIVNIIIYTWSVFGGVFHDVHLFL